MYIVTGTAGFIGSQLALALDSEHRLLLVDDPELTRERGYIGPRKPTEQDHAAAVTPDPWHSVVDYRYLPKLLEKLTPQSTKETETLVPKGEEIRAIFHIGAITDTSRTRDLEEMRQWNTEYSKTLWHWCAKHKVPFIYASTAASYGLGENGFADDHDIIPKLKPLNPYAISKHEFDLWVLDQVKQGKETPPQWYGLKFFNVYGPNEGHKGRMASTILHSFRNLQTSGEIPLFRSHREDIPDGEQKRDFIHVSDVVKVLRFMESHQPESGIYNLGTGEARPFIDMARTIFTTLGREEKIKWIDTPPEFREFYQYFTEADMTKLRQAGYQEDFLTLEEGVSAYTRWLQACVEAEAVSQETMH